ncbi:hypothetical protein I4U23_008324 [Adineta vaga]|nr:hypothetical protein I4U23_008324 [Adineta vaga]
MISREKDTDYQNALYYDLILDDITLSNFDGSTEQLQHLLNIDCALALSVCKSRNLPSCVFVLSLLYMKRLRSLHCSSTLSTVNDLTTKELYLIATLLANKYLVDEGEDEQLFNSELAELTNISTERINLIERQVLIALNWNLYISNDEFQQFLTLFKCQMARKLHKTIKKIDTDDPMKFYSLCLQYLPHALEYLALTSLVLLGSTISILTAIHMSTLTQATLMKALHPPSSTNCSHPSISFDHLDNQERTNKSYDLFNFQTDFLNESNNQHPSTFYLPSSYSMNLLRTHSSFSRPFIQTFG